MDRYQKNLHAPAYLLCASSRNCRSVLQWGEKKRRNSPCYKSVNKVEPFVLIRHPSSHPHTFNVGRFDSRSHSGIHDGIPAISWCASALIKMEINSKQYASTICQHIDYSCALCLLAYLWCVWGAAGRLMGLLPNDREVEVHLAKKT